MLASVKASRLFSEKVSRELATAHTNTSRLDCMSHASADGTNGSKWYNAGVAGHGAM